jgi:hypothetical protein
MAFVFGTGDAVAKIDRAIELSEEALDSCIAHFPVARHELQRLCSSVFYHNFPAGAMNYTEGGIVFVGVGPPSLP